MDPFCVPIRRLLNTFVSYFTNICFKDLSVFETWKVKKLWKFKTQYLLEKSTTENFSSIINSVFDCLLVVLLLLQISVEDIDRPKLSRHENWSGIKFLASFARRVGAKTNLRVISIQILTNLEFSLCLGQPLIWFVHWFRFVCFC